MAVCRLCVCVCVYVSKNSCIRHRVFRKAIAVQSMDNMYVIASAWTRFERCYGTLEQLKMCQEKCAERLSTEDRQTFGTNASSSYGDQRNKGVKRKYVDRGHGAAVDRQQKRQTARDGDRSLSPRKNEHVLASKKSNRMAKVVEQPPPNKRARLENIAEIHDVQMVDTVKDNVTIFLSNLDYK